MPNRPWEAVKSRSYFAAVLGNMKTHVKEEFQIDPIQIPSVQPPVFVRWGSTGNGMFPNYQFDTPSGNFRYSGMTHKRFHSLPDESFDAAHLSEPFTYAQVQEMMRAITAMAA